MKWINEVTQTQIDEARENADVNALLTDRGFEPLKNHLAAAAIAKKAIKACIKEGKHDEAWSLLHSQQTDYLYHASAHGFTAEQIIALTGTVQEQFANILRIEKKHHQALVHIIYWVATAGERPTKAQASKLSAYFKRCKFEGVMFETVQDFTKGQSPLPDILAIQQIVETWRHSTT